MSEAAHELLGRVLGGLAADVRAGAARVVRGGAPGAAADDEALHDFRVSLRRLRTLLRVARTVHGEKKMRALGEALGRIADATGALRDGEVLRETLGGLHLGDDARRAVAAFAEERVRAERHTRAAVVALLRGAPGPEGRATEVGEPLASTLDALERRLAKGPAGDKRAAPESALEVARASLERALRDVAARAGDDVGDVEAMHALRIRFKRLRYTAELFAAHVGDLAATATKASTKMQKRLGELHDLDEAIVVIRGERALHRSVRREVLAALRMARAKTAVRALEELASAEHALSRVERRLGALDTRGAATADGAPDHADAAGRSPPVDVT